MKNIYSNLLLTKEARKLEKKKRSSPLAMFEWNAGHKLRLLNVLRQPYIAPMVL